MKYLLDTHAWIWWNARPESLSPKVRQLLSRPSRYEELLLSAISVREFGDLVREGELALSCAAEDWIAEALAMPGLRLVPLSPTIARRSTALPDGLAGDAADEIIVATARDENATVITKDAGIGAYPHVRSFW